MEEKAIATLREVGKSIPKLFGIKSGVEGLDDLFFTTQIEGGEVIKKPLGGLPYLSVTNITGVSDTGKSLMVEQFAVTQASLGYKVLFVSVESPSPFVAASLKERARALNISWQEIEDNIVLIDASTYASLREDVNDLIKTMDFAIENYKTHSVVIDSITGIYEAREMMARSIVRKLFNFMKLKRQTALFVSQKRSSHEELSAEAAGGYAVSHIVDCTMVLSKEVVLSRYVSERYGVPIGEVIRMFRIDGCRLCGHDTQVREFIISEEGIVKIGRPIKDITAK